MMTYIPIQEHNSNIEQKYKVIVETNLITYNDKNFVVPILIQTLNQEFKPGDKLIILVNDLTIPITVEVNNNPKNNNYFEGEIYIPTTEKGKKLDLILNITLNNENSETCSINVSLPEINEKSINLSTSSIIGITVTIVVLIGLIGWIVYLTKKRKQQKIIDRYHNKRKKNS